MNGKERKRRSISLSSDGFWSLFVLVMYVGSSFSALVAANLTGRILPLVAMGGSLSVAKITDLVLPLSSLCVFFSNLLVAKDLVVQFKVVAATRVRVLESDSDLGPSLFA